jgi:hypothetical protein
MTLHDAPASGGAGLTRGRFEAEFEEVEAARAAARDARAAGFVVDPPRKTASGWQIAGRHKLPFPEDDRDRYANRVRTIATRHGGEFGRFVQEPLTHADD